MVHLCTYQNEFITRYARLSTMLEVATILAHHTQREVKINCDKYMDFFITWFLYKLIFLF